jgi:hypothetical protein
MAYGTGAKWPQVVSSPSLIKSWVWGWVEDSSFLSFSASLSGVCSGWLRAFVQGLLYDDESLPSSRSMSSLLLTPALPGAGRCPEPGSGIAMPRGCASRGALLRAGRQLLQPEPSPRRS